MICVVMCVCDSLGNKVTVDIWQVLSHSRLVPQSQREDVDAPPSPHTISLDVGDGPLNLVQKGQGPHVSQDTLV